MKENVDADEAVNILLEQAAGIKAEKVNVSEAFGRVLAEDIYAKEMVPPFARSPFDGYAFRGEDTKSATKDRPVILSVVEEIPAGKIPIMEITEGKAAKILTGAPMPKGANATIKYENTEFTDEEVKIFYPVAPNKDVVPAGEDMVTDDLIASIGTVITPPIMGMSASVGISAVSVYKRPTVTIINTGNELIEADAPFTAAKVRNSSFYTLHGYLHENGVTVRNGGIVDDNPERIAERVLTGLSNSEMVITTGGVSVGDYDWVNTAIEQLGAEVLFRKISMKPGGSMLAAKLGGKLILGLSGNPGSTVIGLMRVVMPYIKKLCGRKDVLPKKFDVILKGPFEKENRSTRLLRGWLEFEACAAYFLQFKSQGNGIISSLKDCNLLGEIPAGSPPLPAGSRINAFLI